MALALSITPAIVAAEPVILVFDLQRAISLSKAGKSMQKQVEAHASKARENEAEAVKELQDEFSKLREQQNLIAPEALQSKANEIRTKEVEIRQSLAEAAQSIEAGGQKVAQQIFKIAEEELTAISKERKADIVLQRAAVFFASPSINVTEELVARLDKRLSKVTVTPVVLKKAGQ